MLDHIGVNLSKALLLQITFELFQTSSEFCIGPDKSIAFGIFEICVILNFYESEFIIAEGLWEIFYGFISRE